MYASRNICRRPSLPGALAGASVAALLVTSLSWPALADAALADLVERVSPSVVTVLTTQTALPAAGAVHGGPQVLPFPPGSPFEEFFRRFANPGGEESGGALRHSLGSGFVIEDDGYIVTNNHVVENASEVKVRLTDEREFDARVVGTDPQTDLALLKIDARNLPELQLGDSDRLRVGDDVIAVGNPFGLGGTVTTGIVSAKGRDIQAGPYVDFIQTDAAINRGNSGGPLFDDKGLVVGVNSAIYSPTGGSVGVGFAIPSNTVRAVVAELKSSGAVNRGWLGVSVQSVTPQIGAALGMESPHGALVAEVMPESPSQGVLKTGDVILSFNGASVQDSRDLPRLVASAKAGATVKVKVLREGRERMLDIRVGALQGQRRASADDSAPDGGLRSEKLGAMLASLTPESRGAYGLDESAAGALVTALDPDGPAARAGLLVGDVIERVGDNAVAAPHDVDPAVVGLGRDVALLLVKRGEGQMFVGVTLAA